MAKFNLVYKFSYHLTMELCPIVLTLVFQLIIILELYENCIKHDGVAEGKISVAEGNDFLNQYW